MANRATGKILSRRLWLEARLLRTYRPRLRPWWALAVVSAIAAALIRPEGWQAMVAAASAAALFGAAWCLWRIGVALWRLRHHWRWALAMAGIALVVIWSWPPDASREIQWPRGEAEPSGRQLELTTRWAAGSMRWRVTVLPSWEGGTAKMVVADTTGWRDGCGLVLRLRDEFDTPKINWSGDDGDEASGSVPMSRSRYLDLLVGRKWALATSCP